LPLAPTEGQPGKKFQRRSSREKREAKREAAQKSKQTTEQQRQAYLVRKKAKPWKTAEKYSIQRPAKPQLVSSNPGWERLPTRATKPYLDQQPRHSTAKKTGKRVKQEFARPITTL